VIFGAARQIPGPPHIRKVLKHSLLVIMISTRNRKISMTIDRVEDPTSQRESRCPKASSRVRDKLATVARKVSFSINDFLLMEISMSFPPELSRKLQADPEEILMEQYVPIVMELSFYTSRSREVQELFRIIDGRRQVSLLQHPLTRPGLVRAKTVRLGPGKEVPVAWRCSVPERTSQLVAPQ